MCCEPRSMISLALCSFQRRRKRAREREVERALAGLHARAGEAGEKNESLGARKENQEPALGWKEKSVFIAPCNRLGEKTK